MEFEAPAQNFITEHVDFLETVAQNWNSLNYNGKPMYVLWRKLQNNAQILIKY